MIDPRKTGGVISRLRRSRDWTQVELAERLNVTHQAVSCWEIGDSFPDLVVLYSIAQLFGVRVDDILGRPSAQSGDDRSGLTTGDVLTELAQDNIAAVAARIQEGETGLESLADARSLIRPSQMDRVVHELTDFAFNAEQVIGLAPFVSQPVLDRLVEQYSGSPDAPFVVGLAPFASKTALDSIVNRVADGAIPADSLVALAPFVSREALSRAMAEARNGPLQANQIASMAPFVDRITLEALIRRAPG